MRILTVRQPWAWAIIHGGKNVENRTQRWSYRGPLAIHAGQRWSYRGGFSPLVIDAARRAGLGDWAAHDGQGILRPSAPLSLPAGAIIGVVDLVDIHTAEQGCCDSPWAEYLPPDPWATPPRRVTHLVLTNQRPVEPIPCRGALGLWTVPDHLTGDLT